MIRRTAMMLSPAGSGSGSGFSRQERSATLAYASTITPDADTTDVGNITATGAFTLENPSGTPTDFQSLVIAVSASGGSWDMTLGSGYEIPSSSTLASPITISSGTIEVFAFRYCTLNSRWLVVSAVPGY